MKFYEILVATTTYHKVAVWGENEHEAVENFKVNLGVNEEYWDQSCPRDEVRAVSVKFLDTFHE